MRLLWVVVFASLIGIGGCGIFGTSTRVSPAESSVARSVEETGSEKKSGGKIIIRIVPYNRGRVPGER